MTIGEALKEEQKRLGLTSEAMAAGVITKGTYSKVVNGKLRLSSDLLAEILFKHDIDINDFFEMIKSTYMPKEKLEEEMLTREFKLALDNHEIQKAKHSKLNSELIIRRDSRFTIFVLSVELKW